MTKLQYLSLTFNPVCTNRNFKNCVAFCLPNENVCVFKDNEQEEEIRKAANEGVFRNPFQIPFEEVIATASYCGYEGLKNVLKDKMFFLCKAEVHKNNINQTKMEIEKL